ncbi:MAG: hypothetical protein CME65_14615 [Halobacteriovoraceae bacterium]|nr:hypothetical protein [Halobacteriovoraceae bacterium]|tara:strand:+ start:3404 stop:3607 length:204 start_codon:yes stop_codon:yes gene_type:complete
MNKKRMLKRLESIETLILLLQIRINKYSDAFNSMQEDIVESDFLNICGEIEAFEKEIRENKELPDEG